MAPLPRALLAGFLFLVPICTFAGCSLLNLPAAIQGGYSVHEASYGTGPLDKLDIYIPRVSRKDKHDVIVFYDGGRWRYGKKENSRFVGAALARRGYVTVIPEFRKYPEVHFPVFVEDGARALAWVDEHIAEYAGRPDRIHLAGHSSGAHMAALLTVDTHYLAAEGKDARVIIKDFAALAGPYAFTPADKDLVEIFGPPDRYPQMQATTFVKGKEPPMLLLYGVEDKTVLSYNHERLAQRIREKGGHVEVITYPELGHIGMIGTFSGFGPHSSVVDDMTTFFKTRNGD